eukprot:COSAG02_NODE_1190_length_13989_cov_9.869978_7_plen_52_part_00
MHSGCIYGRFYMPVVAVRDEGAEVRRAAHAALRSAGCGNGRRPAARHRREG